MLDVCFLWVDEEDEDEELLCDQHAADIALAKAKAANLFLLTANVCAPNSM